MAKKIKIDEERYALDVAKRIGASQRRVLSIFRTAIHEASLIAELAPFDPAEPFRFDLYPVTKRRSDLLIDQLYRRVLGEVTASISYAWGRAHDKDDDLERLARGSVATGLRRDEALAAFIARRDGGMSLSDRVWRSANQARQELEMAIDLGLREGQDAPALSRSVRAYLIEPERLFRRVRDMHGELHLSKRAEAYHPGRGVYRSSYKNALRLTATETNIAYRTADYERVQELDFVRGVRVNLSKNHTLNGKPFTCICDEFAGDYPKDFKFVGWHPLCRCYTTTILAEDPDNPEETPAVKEVPAGMREWIATNNDKVKTLLAQGKPAYWLRDNVRHLLRKKTEVATPKSAVFSPSDYTRERKDAAVWARTDEESIELLKGRADDIYDGASTVEKNAIYAYTQGSASINRPLRGYDRSWSSFKGVGLVPLDNESEKAPRRISAMDRIISRSTYDEDVWVQRGVDANGLKAFLGIKSLSELPNTVGRSVLDAAYVSCGAAKGTGFGGYILNIYCPRGTKMLYIDGRSFFPHENEMLIMRNTTFRVAKVDGNFIDLEVIDQ